MLGSAPHKLFFRQSVLRLPTLLLDMVLLNSVDSTNHSPARKILVCCALRPRQGY